MKYLIRFIGQLLIILAFMWDMCRKILFFVLVVGIFMGLFMLTMITFFELIAPNQMVGSPFDAWYWNLIVCAFAGTTLVLTLWRLGRNAKLMGE